MRAKLASEEGREIYKKRLYTAEPALGNMEWKRRRIMMSLRGLEKVTGQFSLKCLVPNGKKMTKKVLEGYVSWFRGKALGVAQFGDWLRDMMLVEA